MTPSRHRTLRLSRGRCGLTALIALLVCMLTSAFSYSADGIALSAHGVVVHVASDYYAPAFDDGGLYVASDDEGDTVDRAVGATHQRWAMGKPPASVARAAHVHTGRCQSPAVLRI